MEVVNLLNFINSVKNLYTLEYAKCTGELVDFLDLMTEDEQFTRTIDLGIVYVNQKTTEQYLIVDGLRRILSLSLLLHAICECYKKTTPRNEKAINTIRTKYLVNGLKSKLRLNEEDNVIYNKIINGERLSGHEKATPMFKLLHSFWTQIKHEKLQASNIFAMLNKITITLVETDEVSKRDLYCKLNSSRELNQILFIEDFLKEKGASSEWENLKKMYSQSENDILLFLKDFFITKFNYKNFSNKRIYESFVNYFETMIQYMPKEALMQRLYHSASLYYNILNVNFESEQIKKSFIKIKKNFGDDTFAYILNVYEDFSENNISEATFIEILNTIAEYLQNRKNNNNNIDFNELIQYLNAFIVCK